MSYTYVPEELHANHSCILLFLILVKVLLEEHSLQDCVVVLLSSVKRQLVTQNDNGFSFLDDATLEVTFV